MLMRHTPEHIYTHMNIVTYRINRPRRRFVEKTISSSHICFTFTCWSFAQTPCQMTRIICVQDCLFYISALHVPMTTEYRERRVVSLWDVRGEVATSTSLARHQHVTSTYLLRIFTDMQQAVARTGKRLGGGGGNEIMGRGGVLEYCLRFLMFFFLGKVCHLLSSQILFLQTKGQGD